MSNNQTKGTPQSMVHVHAYGDQLQKEQIEHASDKVTEVQKPTEEYQAKGPENRTWANLVGNDRFGLRGMNLSFVAPIVKNGETIVELAKK